MDADTRHWVNLGILNIPVFLVLGKLVFDGWSGFFECLRFWLTPDVISLFRGEWLDDWWGTLKLFVFIALCASVVCGENKVFFENKPGPRISQSQPNPPSNIIRLA